MAVIDISVYFSVVLLISLYFKAALFCHLTLQVAHIAQQCGGNVVTFVKPFFFFFFSFPSHHWHGFVQFATRNNNNSVSLVLAKVADMTTA